MFAGVYEFKNDVNIFIDLSIFSSSVKKVSSLLHSFYSTIPGGVGRVTIVVNVHASFTIGPLQLTVVF